MLLAAALLFLAPPAADGPVLEDFQAPLDPARWYVGTGRVPAKGSLNLEKDGFIAARGITDALLTAIEVRFTGTGVLELSLHDGREPLSRPTAVLTCGRGKGERLLRVTAKGAQLDGAPLKFAGDVPPAKPVRGAFRLTARRGAVRLLAVHATPRIPDPEPQTELDKRTVHLLTTPTLHTVGSKTHERQTLVLWDVEVAFLLRAADKTRFAPLHGTARKAPTLGALVGLADGTALARKAGGHALALRDWGDEKRNLSGSAYRSYLAREYALFDLLHQAQRALNLAVPGRKDLAPLADLAAIRHAPNTLAAIALAETRGAKEALALLRKAVGGRKPDLARTPPDQLRHAAGEAARALLGDNPPAAWPGFAFHPTQRFVTVQQAKDLARG